MTNKYWKINSSTQTILDAFFRYLKIFPIFFNLGDVSLASNLIYFIASLTLTFVMLFIYKTWSHSPTSNKSIVYSVLSLFL